MEKIAIIIHQTNEASCKRLLQELSSLNIPQGYFVDVIVITDAGSKAAAYNAAMQGNSAKYKIYIDETATILNKNLLVDVEEIFADDGRIGMVGLYGSEMPITGDITQSKNRYGLLGHTVDKSHINLEQGKNPLFSQNVQVVDGLFMATAVDTLWDEMVAEEFLAAAKCLALRERNYFVTVPMQEMPWCSFRKMSAYQKKRREKDFTLFFQKYTTRIQPLVSILMTTYNQPVFFKQALDSALAQDYKNIEIIVGDDSTNEDTKRFMADYVKKYPQIKYYYHGGPLGGIGLANAKFVLNKASGNFVNYLFHDDLFYPNKISTMMAAMTADLKEEIGMVTSARNIINEKGEVLGRMSPWQPTQDTVLAGSEMARKIFTRFINYIGEMTTVLIRKPLLKQANGEYFMGCFAGVRDKALGDVATFLDIAWRGRSCLFLSDTLSCYRHHSDQNTYKPAVIVHATMEWLHYITISRKQTFFIRSEQELASYYNTWYKIYKGTIERCSRHIKLDDPELGKQVRYLLDIEQRIIHKDYKAVYELSDNYINTNCEIIKGLEGKEKTCR